MTIPVEVEGLDDQGRSVRANVVTRRGKTGLRVYTEADREVIAFNRPFTNPAFGLQMAQNVGFTGIPTIIHAGVNSGSAESGTTDGATTAFKLIQSGQNFTTTVAVGHSVANTTDTTFAIVTAVDSNTQLTLDTDIMATGENYEINQIWVGAAIAGAWNFADAGKVTITGANNNDSAVFNDNAGQTWSVDNFTALTGKIDLDTYDETLNTVLLSFSLNGVPVGDTMNLNDFISTANFTEQTFIIGKDAFNFGSALINEMTILITRSGGAKPTIKFDDIQWEEIGEPLDYRVTPADDEVLRIDELILAFTDDISGIATVAGATENSTMTGLSYNKFLGVSELANGVGFRRVEDNIVGATLTFRKISDFMAAGANITNVISDTTNTFVTLSIKFPDPVRLFASSADFISFTVNDDLSSLISFTIFARGSIELSP